MAALRLSLVVIACAPALLAASAALAGPVADSALPSWTGPFLGLEGGFAAAKITSSDLSVPGATNAVVYQFSDQKSVYRLSTGYDQEFGDRYVWGVELGADWLGFNIDPQSSGGFGSPFSADYDLTLTGRLGMLASPGTLVYARAGLGLTDVKADQGFFDTAHKLLPAALFGVGVETMLTKGVSARIQADYSTPIQSFSIPSDFEAFDPRYLRITGGLVWRLDAEKPSTLVASRPNSDAAFSGGYSGLIAGYQLSQMRSDVSTPGSTVGPFAAENGTFGASVGYDIRSQMFVGGLGVELQAMKAEFFDPSQNSPLLGSTKLFGTIDNTLMLTGRAGVVVDPSTLIYIKAGVGMIRTTANPDFFTFGSGGPKWLLGHELGAGVETMVTDALSVKLEGLYTTADQGYSVDLTQTDQATLHPSSLSAVAGLAWHY